MFCWISFLISGYLRLVFNHTLFNSVIMRGCPSFGTVTTTTDVETFFCSAFYCHLTLPKFTVNSVTITTVCSLFSFQFSDYLHMMFNIYVFNSLVIFFRFLFFLFVLLYSDNHDRVSKTFHRSVLFLCILLFFCWVTITTAFLTVFTVQWLQTTGWSTHCTLRISSYVCKHFLLNN